MKDNYNYMKSVFTHSSNVVIFNLLLSLVSSTAVFSSPLGRRVLHDDMSSQHPWSSSITVRLDGVCFEGFFSNGVVRLASKRAGQSQVSDCKIFVPLVGVVTRLCVVPWAFIFANVSLNFLVWTTCSLGDISGDGTVHYTTTKTESRKHDCIWDQSFKWNHS